MPSPALRKCSQNPKKIPSQRRNQRRKGQSSCQRQKPGGEKLLAEKAAADDGKYRSDVKFLVKKFGKGGALKDVAPEDYAALVAEAEALGNG